MDDAKAQLTDKIRSASNVLVTVSRNPSVDQLSALLGLTLFLNKQGKHAAAVFSGQVPSTIEFLQPEETIEKNTDSLRDFIIALDKSKADKLRYKVEDNVVRIFITPYKTSISDKDLEFSQGDFNVDVVVAVGVTQQEDLDEAITAHGRILHDATVASVNLGGEGELGSINWRDPQASSLSELVAELAQALDQTQIDNQIATALLTGIVAETKRFSNEKTTSQTMNMSAMLMAAGANQQLVASKLEEPQPPKEDEGGDNDATDDQDKSDAAPTEDNGDGVIEIDHEAQSEKEADEAAKDDESAAAIELPAPEESSADAETSPETADLAPEPAETPAESPELAPVNEAASASDTSSAILSNGTKPVTEPPSMGGMLTANTQPESLGPAADPLSQTAGEQPAIISREDSSATLPSTTVPVDEQPDSNSSFDESATPETPVPTTETSQPASADVPAGAADLPSTDAPSGFTPPPPAWTPPADPSAEPAAPLSTLPADTAQLVPPSPNQPTNTNNPSFTTLSELEASVESPHTADVSDARDEVSRALSSSEATTTTPPEPVQALNAQPFGGNLHDPAPAEPEAAAPAPDAAQPLTPDPVGLPQASTPPSTDNTTPPSVPLPQDIAIPADSSSTPPQVVDSTAPPPVPPPIPFQFGTPPSPPSQS